MSESKRMSIFLASMILGVLMGFSTAGFAQSMMPENIASDFEPGYGGPVGSIELVQGNVTIQHADMAEFYKAMSGLPVYKGDTIVTYENGRIRFALNDKSVLTLASNTKMVINQSVYSPERKTRTGFFNMLRGKAKFVIQKLAGLRQSDVRVKTATAVCGVRGSEWVQIVTEANTKVITGENTRLEVISLAVPNIEPLLLEDFQQTDVAVGELPSEVTTVSPAYFRELLQEFEFDTEIVEEYAEFLKREKQTPAAAPKTILVSDQNLTDSAPDPETDFSMADAPAIDIAETSGLAEQKEMIKQDITDQVAEVVSRETPLPDFPDLPPPSLPEE